MATSRTAGGTTPPAVRIRPLPVTPRLALDIPQVIVEGLTDRAGFERQPPGTFGSRQWLWSENDELLDNLPFDKDSHELVSVGFHLPAE